MAKLTKTTPQQVIADLRTAGLFKVAKRQVRRAVRESGLEVRKHDLARVSISIADWNGADSWGEDHWMSVLEALHAAGYGFVLLDGTIGESAREWAQTCGAVLVYRTE